MTNANESPFANLVLLRVAHSDLLQGVTRDGSDKHRNAILSFLKRGAATGAILDSPADREVAQGLLDYWRASLYTARRDQPQTDDQEGEPITPIRVAPAFLADFDETAANALVCALEQTVAGPCPPPRPPKPPANRPQPPAGDSPSPDVILTGSGLAPEKVVVVVPTEDQSLVRRILLQVVRFQPERNRFASHPVKRTDLESGADAGRVRPIVDALVKSGALRITPMPDGDRVELASESLMRHWPRLAKWLEQRRSLHDAARVWQEAGRDRGTLLSGAPLREALELPNLEALELEFLNAGLASQSDRDRAAAALKASNDARLQRRMLLASAALGVALVFLIAILVLREHNRRLAEDEKTARLLQLGTARYLAEGPWNAQADTIKRYNAETEWGKPVAWGLWEPGKELWIKYLGGDDDLKDDPDGAKRKRWIEKITSVRDAYKEHTSITFLLPGESRPERTGGSSLARQVSFFGSWGGKVPAAPEIRISFRPKFGLWSYRGKDALFVPPNQATMNLGGLPDDASDADYEHAVYYCFGMALGLVNELQNPSASELIDWEAYVRAKDELGAAAADWGVGMINRRFRPYDRKQLPWYNLSRPFDADSVMMPPLAAIQPLEMPEVEKKLQEMGIPSKNGLSLPFRSVNKLSQSDVEFLKKLYPPVNKEVKHIVVEEGKDTPAKTIASLRAFRHVQRFIFPLASRSDSNEEWPYVTFRLQRLPESAILIITDPDGKPQSPLPLEGETRYVRYRLQRRDTDKSGNHMLEIISNDLGHETPTQLSVEAKISDPAAEWPKP